MLARQLGPIGELVANRPVILAVLSGVGVAALLAVAFRSGALQTTGPAYFGYVLAFLLCLAAPTLLAAITPGVRLVPVALGVGLMALAFAEPLWRASAAPLAGFWAQPSTTGQVVLALAGLAVLSRVWLRPGLFALQGFVLAALLSLAGLAAFVSIGTAAQENPAIASAGANAYLTVGVTLALCAAAWTVQRHAALFAEGAGNAEAAGRAASQAAPYVAFLILAAVSALGVDLLSEAAARRAGEAAASAMRDAGVNMIAAMAAPAVVTVLLGAAALSLAREDENTAYLFNQRDEAANEGVARLRPYLSTNTGIAAVAILAIIAITAAFDLRRPLHASELLAVVFLAIAAMGAFISVRAGLIFGGLMMCVVLPVRWIFGAPAAGAAQGEAPMIAASAILVAGALLAPLALEWREARSPWRKAREVAIRAVVRAAPAFATGLLLAMASLLAAYGSGFWPAAGAAARWALLYALAGFLIAPFWLVGFGALFGRGQ